MLSGYRRGLPLAAGLAATAVLGVAGCTSIVTGDPSVDRADVPDYRASVSASVSASAVTSSVRESQRQASMTTQAVRTVCETLSTSSADAVKTVNAYVEAVNSGGDVAATIQPAREALSSSAGRVSAEINDTLPVALRDALTAWVDASRAAGDVLGGGPSPSEFNTAIDRVNTTRTDALNLCDTAY